MAKNDNTADVFFVSNAGGDHGGYHYNVGIAIINHPPFITKMGGIPTIKKRVVYDIAIPTLPYFTILYPSLPKSWEPAGGRDPAYSDPCGSSRNGTLAPSDPRAVSVEDYDMLSGQDGSWQNLPQ